MSEYQGCGARSRPGGLSIGAPNMRVKLVSHAGLVVVVLVSTGRVVAACERDSSLGFPCKNLNYTRQPKHGKPLAKSLGKRVRGLYAVGAASSELQSGVVVGRRVAPPVGVPGAGGYGQRARGARARRGGKNPKLAFWVETFGRL